MATVLCRTSPRLLTPKLAVNAVEYELAWSVAPFLSTTIAAKHPVELFRHLTHKTDNTSSLHNQRSQSMPIWATLVLSGCVSVRSTFRRYAMATSAFVHCMSRQLVFGDPCLGLGSGGRRGFRGIMSSPPSATSSRIGSSVLLLGLHHLPHLVLSGFTGFSSLTCSDLTGRFEDRQWHRISLVSFRLHVDVVHVVLFVRKPCNSGSENC